MLSETEKSVSPRATSHKENAPDDQLEGLQAAVIVARRSLESLPTVAELLTTETPAGRRSIRSAFQTAKGWSSSVIREIKKIGEDSIPCAKRDIVRELSRSIEEIARLIAIREGGMRAVWSRSVGRKKTQALLERGEMAAATREMFKLRHSFWARLCSFPFAANERLRTLERCDRGELKLSSSVYTQRSDPRTARDLTSEVREVLSRASRDDGGLPPVSRFSFDTALGSCLARLPGNPERMLELCTGLTERAARLQELSTSETRSVRLDSTPDTQDILRSELGGDWRFVASKVANLVEARDAYLELRDYLFTANLPLADNWAKRCAAQKCRSARDDIHQASRFGLLRAVERWDPEVGTGFSTAATWWIEDAIIKANSFVPAQVPVPSHARACFNQLRRMSLQELSSLDVDLSAQRFKVSSATFSAVRSMALGCMQGLPVDPHAWSVTSLRRTLIERSNSEPNQIFDERENFERVSALLRKLPDRERLILSLRFGLGSDAKRGLTNKEIAERIGLCTEAVRLAVGRALRWLKEDARRGESLRLAGFGDDKP